MSAPDVRRAVWDGYSAKDGLIFKNGAAVQLPRADQIARDYGFQYAEEMVRELQKFQVTRTTHTPEGIAREKLPPGCHENIPSERYHAAFGVSNSDLKKFAESPEIYRNARILGFKEDDSDLTDDERKSRAMGTLLHAAILQPHLFGEGISHYQKPETYMHPKEGMKPWNGNATVCKDWKEAHDDKPVISPKELRRIHGARDAILNHAVSGPLFAGPGANEVSIVAEHPGTGLTLRMRADRIAQDAMDNNWLIDIKSVVDVDAFVRSCRQFSYPIQSIHYSRTAKLAGINDVLFCFVCVELKPRYNVHPVRVVMMSEATKAEAEATWNQLLVSFAKCQAENVFPASGTQIEIVHVRTFSQ